MSAPRDDTSIRRAVSRIYAADTMMPRTPQTPGPVDLVSCPHNGFHPVSRIEFQHARLARFAEDADGVLHGVPAADVDRSGCRGARG
jgi:hypothetical protein